MASIQAVTVYCSSSSAIAPSFVTAAESLGAAIAGAGWTLVFGGNHVGLMAKIADSARSHGGSVVGITPQLMVDHGVHDPRCDELVVTTTMRERKHLLEQRGDALIALPGGIGTYEELFEVLVGKQLGYHTKPIVLLDVDGYFEPLLALIDAGIRQKFIKPSARELFLCTPLIPDAISYVRNYSPIPVPSKWFTPQPPSSIE